MDNKLLLIVSIFLSVLVMEQGLQWFGPVDYESASRTFVPGIGQWRSPNSFVPRPRYSDEGHNGYYTNSIGMVDDEIELAGDRLSIVSDGPPAARVAFLGDSIIEGLAVPPGNRVTDLVERDSNGRLDVLNFSTSGTGTIQQLAIYRALVRQYAPDLVVLSLFPANDIANNYRTLDRSLGSNFLNDWISADLVDDSLVFVLPAQPVRAERESTRETIRKLLPATYAHLAVVKSRLRWPSLHVGLESAALAEGNLDYLSVYREHPPNSDWTKAWHITEVAILDLRKQVEKDGSQFVLAILPDPIHSYEAQGFQLTGASNAVDDQDSTIKYDALSPFYPHERLAAFAQAHSIRTIPLYRSFKYFQDDNQLEPPYFGFATDGHWSSIGHRVAADSLLPALLTTTRADSTKLFTDGRLPARH